ncbi:ATP-binding protein [Aerosakkonema funiforme]|uniref:AAA family ATPase n=1 Tax=Aerosakkonema funiforme FACHB-1375 TaxID=2949571 RepID=A0A926VL86_9CYAN|nr:ATP-binding protein [Aerosakkonema funiforme]MBD2185866.1 AAA family ATPase [Aerosakkonema funiforme FACHB-1375]
MASIDDIIRREVNPFDPTTFKPGNFWREKQDAKLTVDSIHQEAIAEIEELLDLIAKDHRSRTVLLTGDTGSGKSYLLGRLKRAFNRKAFFAYIGPWPNNDYIRRHILRYTVDSLMQVPEGQKDSQLMLWLKSLSAFTKRSLKQRIFDESVWQLLRSNRQKFIRHLKDSYKEAGIYNADSFFGVLYDLTDPELYPLACEWLRGDDLSEESLQELKVRRSIETEEAAWETLSNLGRISTETQPIVLCFDNTETGMNSEGDFNPQPFFNVNTTIHNDGLKNFLIVISFLTDGWKRVIDRIQMSDKAGIHQEVHLKRINLDQAEALWAFRLKLLHSQAKPQPTSSIFPLTRQALEIKFPGGKTDPRNTLILGGHLFDKYKKSIIATSDKDDERDEGNNANNGNDPNDKVLAAFKLIWQDEYKKAQIKIIKISLLAAPELIRMLAEALAALQFQGIKPKLLSGKYSGHSLSYENPNQQKRVGIVWTEDPSMTSFVHIMNACQKVIQQNACENLHLIRGVTVGNGKLAGYQIYKQIFTGSQHHHIKPTLSSVHYLAAYHSLVNSALANELVVAGKPVSLKELEDLIRNAEILNNCILLQGLGIVRKADIPTDNGDFKEVREFLLNVVKTQGYLSKNTLNENAVRKFSEVNQTQVEQLIQQLIKENKIQLVNPKDPPKDHLVCFVPQV